MKKLALILLFGMAAFSILTAQHRLTSPDGAIEVAIEKGASLAFSVAKNGEALMRANALNLFFDGAPLYRNQAPAATRYSVDEAVTVAFPYKHRNLKEQYNGLKLDFGDGWVLHFRAYNDGVAYRYETDQDTETTVNESLELAFPADFPLWHSPVSGFMSSQEVPYEKTPVSALPDSVVTYLPVLAAAQDGLKLLITEADVYDYPHLFLQGGDGDQHLEAVFPPFPLTTELVRDRSSRVTESAGYIARTNGKRTFPWRVFIVTEQDAQLVESDLVYLLARTGETKDTDWIRPGRVAWDWWNASNLAGVDFKTGLNTDTWKYYIDFAAKHGLEYIILDEGWSISTTDLSRPNPDLDLQELIKYGDGKGVRLILWTTWRALNEQWAVLDRFREWGIAGIKVDFMDRADQWMVNFYEKVAREAFARELLVDFHGAFKPTGLRRQYPNVVSYEGVCGLEQSKWSKKNTPTLNATIPFLRMVCGPMDYTPGAMRNYHPEEFQPFFNRPGSQGTRAHQVALFVLYESGIQMLADSPTNYEKEQETTGFLSHIPVIWEDTRVLAAEVGEVLVVARRNGADWFVAGITGAAPRTEKIDLSFLGEGQYSAVLMQDGINADRHAEDYQLLRREVTRDTRLSVKMTKGGGFAMRLRPL